MSPFTRVFFSILFFSTCLCTSFTYAQPQTFTLASNLPSVHTVDADPDDIRPVILGDSMDVRAIPAGGTPAYSIAWMPDSLFADPTLEVTKFLLQNPFSTRYLTVQSTDSNGCIAMDTIWNLITSVTNHNTAEIEMTLYPNPTAGNLSVLLKGKPTGRPMELIVLNALGRVVYSEQIPRFSGQFNQYLDLSGLSDGAYFLGIYSEGKQVFKMFSIAD